MKSILFGRSHRIEVIDEKSFSKLYEKFWNAAVELVIKLVKDREEAENIAQDVFIQLWEKRDNLHKIDDVQNFLFICLRNKAFDRLKELKKTEQGTEELWQKIQDQPHEKDSLEQQGLNFEKLEKALSELSEHKQRIVTLKYGKNQSYDEIAETLNISANTVKNHLVQIKKRLRSELVNGLILMFYFLF
ncbi:Sigma-70 region 2 [Algoriphagus locisalis]|uniref:Sigma-70 region 2 n=1 Tax=Algoriphagus locisalis TaxID=305507 RepID=A0A1I6XG80_9BACT|nr:sigma-70 family RNA polymerase sigma factor [Algoriphagus locisalis]SFT37136.1 Sigma-70 region 2 [Algoriphagus locisalis]